MGRPVLALSLLAVAALLLGSLFTELEDSIEDPDAFTPDAQALEKAANTAAAHPEYLETMADAGALELLEDAELTIPPGAAEVDGDMLRLLEEVDWTVPSGTEIHDLTLPIPPGTELALPSGTRVEGDTLVFPPGSSIVLEDGTILDLPEGGRMRIPGADAETLKAHIRDGTFTVPPSGGIFTSPTVQNRGHWPMTLPEGTTFRLPDGFTLPEGTWDEGGTVTLPSGERIETDGAGEAPEAGEQKQGLFERIGQIDLTPPEPKSEADPGKDSGATGSGPSVGKALLWGSIALLTVGLGYLAWRHRRRLMGLVAVGTAAAGGLPKTRHPFRLIATFDGRPERLPLALAPGDARPLTIRFEAEHKDADGTVTFRPTRARGRLQLGDQVLHDGPVAVDGTTIRVPPLAAGDHALHLDVQVPGHRSARLTETLRVAPWAEQVAREYDHLAHTVGTRVVLPHGFTPRMLETHAQQVLPSAARPALGTALTLFERANYSRDTIQEADWVRMAETADRLVAVLRPTAEPRPGPRAAAAKTAEAA